MNSERGLITYSKIITAAGPEDSRPRLCDTFRKYLGQAEGPEQACALTPERRLGSWRDCPRNAGPAHLRVNPRVPPTVSSPGSGRAPCRTPELEKDL